MDIFKVVETLQSFPDNPVFAEAARILVEQGEHIVDLENKLGGWIPVSLGLLPEEYVSVLVCIPTEAPLPIVKEAYLANGSWSTKTWIYQRSEVAYWMHMPQPPEEVQRWLKSQRF